MRHLARRPSHPAVACWAWAVLAGLGASPPEVVRARVPESRVAAFFPAGSDLRVLAPDRFEELVRAADRPGPRAAGPRLARASHAARWEGGMLAGRSELTAASTPGAAGPGLLVLDPWSPALAGDGPGRGLARSTADGRLGLRVGPGGPGPVALDWQLRARPGSDGSAFFLALPEADVASLTLDLPDDSTPEADAGLRFARVEPAAPGRSTWRAEAARGRASLRIVAKAGGVAGSPPSLWLSGPTRIDLNERGANWRAEWAVEGPPGRPGSLTVELDPGLDLVDVSGPRVASFRAEGQRATIRLDGGAAGPSPLTIRAICRVPADRPWPVPSARPVDATWTGGRTTVRLDDSRVLQACSERSGRRVAARAGDPTDPTALAFEGGPAPGPVAELTFHRPTFDATAEVRGRLRLAREIPSYDAVVEWRVDRGRMPAHAVDLSPGWSPDSVTSRDGQAVTWHGETLANGSVRVHMTPPSDGAADRPLALAIHASAPGLGISGPLDLPRARPATASVRVSDEVWVATIAPDLAARPIFGSGLAWIDTPPPAPPWLDADLRGSLAWRWLTEDAEARVDRAAATPRPSAEIGLVATIARGRLLLEWTLAADAPAGEAGSIPIRVDDAADLPSRWLPAEPGRADVVARPLAEEKRATQGFPRGGSAWSIEAPAGPRGRVELKGRLERPWSGSGTIPVLTLPARYRARGSIALRVEETARLAIDSAGLTAIEGPEPGEAGPGPGPGTGPRAPDRGEGGLRTAATFAYRGAGGRLALKTVPGSAEPGGGVVREAHLATQAFPGSGLTRHRLTLRIAANSSGHVDLTMPAGATLDRARRDGQAVAPTPIGPGLRFPIPPPSPGRSASTLTLDYRTDGDFRPGLARPSGLLPSVASPCSSFLWELTTPARWRVEVPADGPLLDGDPPEGRGGLAAALGLHPAFRPRASRGPAGPDPDSILAELDRTPGEGPREEALGDWLIRLDSGPRPLVVDRLALQDAGLGPGSRVGSPGSPGAASRRAPSVVLRGIGLRALAGGGVILITSRPPGADRSGPAPSPGEAWSRALREAAGEGSDPSDRFQTPSRWRGEPTPRPSASGLTPDRLIVPETWRTRRLVATGWPSTDAAATLVDSDSEARLGWLVAASALLAGLLARDRPGRQRAAAFALAWTIAAFGIARGWPDPSPAWIGLGRGSLVAVAYWLGRSARDFLAGRGPTGPLPDRPAGRARARVAGFATILAIFGASTLAGGEAPILAVFPYEGAADLAAEPRRVVMLLEDYERLARLAAPAPIPEAARVFLGAIRHRFARAEAGVATVESLCELEVDGEGPASWSFPVGPAFDLAATLDDRPAPLSISRDGRTATLAVVGPGTHRAAFRRSAAISAGGRDGEKVRLPVNRAAFAEVEVARDPRGRRVEVPGAAGRVEAGGEGLVGAFGPEDSLEVRWSAEDRPKAAGPAGPVDALVLWEARPVGDLVRVRLRHSDAEGASALGLALEPGVTVRGYAIPGAIVARPGGTAARPEWTVGIDPPLPKGVPIELTLWRAAVPGASSRALPGFKILGDPPVSALLGFRRPADWSGRLVARDEAEAATDGEFARAWGALPDDGLALAGSIRPGLAAGPVVATGPARPARSVRTLLFGELNAGRLDVTIEADLVDRQGRSFAIEMAVPPDFRVVRVNAEGLLDWLRVARDSVRLQFDGSGGPARKIRVRGYLPAPSEAILSEPRAYQCRVPWPAWSDAEAAPGELTLNSPGRFGLATGEGVAVTSPLGLDDEGLAYQASYRVDRAEGLGALRWSPPPARVGVSVASDLTLDPSAATWTAVIDCDVSGGPAGALQWKLPTAWAEGASLEVVGSPHRLGSEARGATTTWDILPEVPLWGRARLVLRSRKPITPEAPFAFPEIIPMAAPGRGSVASYDLAIANLSGRGLEVAGSAGLQAIDPARYRSAESPAPAGSIRRAYHVTGATWSLRLRLGPGEAGRDLRGDGDSGRASRALVAFGLGRDGETWGRAAYTLAGRAAPFFRLRFAEGARVPWASVDGRPVPVLLEADGRRLIPLGDRPAREVVVAWHAPAGAGRDAKVTLPEAEGGAIPALIEATSPGPPGSLIAPGGLAGLDRAAWEAANLGRLAARIVGLLTEFDRGSRGDRDSALADLVEFELRSRDFDRARPGGSPQAIALVRSARASIEEASQMAGLDDLQEESKAIVGLAPPKAEPVEPGAAESQEPFRVRRIGQSSYFQGTIGAGAAITQDLPPAPGRWARAEPWAILGAGLLIALAMARVISRPFRPHGRAGKVALGLASAALLALEPFGMAALVAAFFLGRSGEGDGAA